MLRLSIHNNSNHVKIIIIKCFIIHHYMGYRQMDSEMDKKMTIIDVHVILYEQSSNGKNMQDILFMSLLFPALL